MTKPTPPEEIHNPGTLISPEEAQAKQRSGATLIDVRGPISRGAQGLIPDAFVIDKQRIGDQLLPESEDRIPSIQNLHDEVVVFCSTEFGSDPVVDALQELGFSRVFQIAGGVTRWKEDGLPVLPQVERSDGQGGSR